MSRTWFAVGLALACLAVSPSEAAVPALKLSLAGPEETVFDWKKDRCEEWDVPDAPFRAFRNDAGKVVALASHVRNRELVGPSLLSVKPNCKIVFEQRRDADPAKHNDLGWIGATWTA